MLSYPPHACPCPPACPVLPGCLETWAPRTLHCLYNNVATTAPMQPLDILGYPWTPSTSNQQPTRRRHKPSAPAAKASAARATSTPFHCCSCPGFSVHGVAAGALGDALPSGRGEPLPSLLLHVLLGSSNLVAGGHLWSGAGEAGAGCCERSGRGAELKHGAGAHAWLTHGGKQASRAWTGPAACSSLPCPRPPWSGGCCPLACSLAAGRDAWRCAEAVKPDNAVAAAGEGRHGRRAQPSALLTAVTRPPWYPPWASRHRVTAPPGPAAGHRRQRPSSDQTQTQVRGCCLASSESCRLLGRASKAKGAPPPHRLDTRLHPSGAGVQSPLPTLAGCGRHCSDELEMGSIKGTNWGGEGMWAGVAV